ncbi:DUF5367 family protein [Cohnella nanjingensis]|uniref:DUF5367 family protein n=1 Tax=Cohnella nanjingensis TaxID=1387779 RepID=A0A7X0VID7_9BACL|nr:DUF5367 family protein [Cohnella nanjingensis]MBB6674846.1 DUF5367 family protein [Cohnella nanjingensis]
MLRQMLILFGLGIAMWAVATLFFVLFGDWLLVAVGEPQFGASLFLLEALTVLVLIGVALIVRLKLFPAPGSATRFGYVGALTGLALDTFVLLNRDSVFRSFDEGQHHAFTIWMTLAYAFCLLVPAVVDRLVRTKREPVRAESEPADDESVEPLV